MSAAARPDRVDFLDKVTGRAAFISDLDVPSMVHGKVLRSTMPHALITSIDASAALAMPGVIGVVTGADLGGVDPIWGVSLKDRPLIATDRVRYVGEPVAVVVAETEAAAEEAEALAPDAPLIHDAVQPLKDFYFKG